MFYYEGLTCPVCETLFTAQDDMVVCPKCGLPHHRECWSRIGHCYEEEKHDTDEQWSRERVSIATQGSTEVASSEDDDAHTNICVRCGAHNPEYAEFCTTCGQQLNSQEWHSAHSSHHTSPVREYTPYSQPDSAFSSDEKIGDYSAHELASYIGKNAPYYIVKFRGIAQGRSCGWNWAAFLFGPFWLFYRKQYGLGLLYFVVHMLSNIAFAVAYAPVQFAESEAAAIAAEAALLESAIFIPVVLLSLIFFVLKIFLGIKGNDLYFRFCEKKIADAKEKTPDLSPAELTTCGGVALGVAVLFYVLSYIAVEFVTLLTM